MDHPQDFPNWLAPVYFRRVRIRQTSRNRSRVTANMNKQLRFTCLACGWPELREPRAGVKMRCRRTRYANLAVSSLELPTTIVASPMKSGAANGKRKAIRGIERESDINQRAGDPPNNLTNI